MDDIIEIGSLLRRLRERAKLSQNYAESAGINRHIVGRVEKGQHRTPSTSWCIETMARALGETDEAVRRVFRLRDEWTCPHCRTYIGPEVSPERDFVRAVDLLVDLAESKDTRAVLQHFTFLDLAHAVMFGAKVLTTRLHAEQIKGGQYAVESSPCDWSSDESELVVAIRKAMEFTMDATTWLHAAVPYLHKFRHAKPQRELETIRPTGRPVRPYTYRREGWVRWVDGQLVPA